MLLIYSITTRKIEAYKFARDNYMVTIYNGKLNCVKGGKSIKSIEKKIVIKNKFL